MKCQSYQFYLKIAKHIANSTKMSSGPGPRPKFKLIDIGANLTDEMYSGIYNGSKKHEGDLDTVLNRAWDSGLDKIFVTAGSLEEARKAAEFVKSNDKLYSTVGVHPTRCCEFDKFPDGPMAYIKQLKGVLEDFKGKIIAVGEFGLDYERTQFCDIETQKKYFQLQLSELGAFSSLPLFLHCRGAATDLCQILSDNNTSFVRGGVVHSFDGTIEEMKKFLELGLHIGINGCSLKTEENCNVVKEIPEERLLLETDAPWCGIRPSHFSIKFVKTKFPAAKKNYDENMMYKTRNEPQTLINVLETVAQLRGVQESELADTIYQNTQKLFFNS